MDPRTDGPPTVRFELDDEGNSSGVEQEDLSDSESINNPFDPEKIDVLTRNPTISLLLARLQRGSIDLAPDFQRRVGLWNQEARSRLIESLLLRIPLPTFYAAENNDETWSMVDGIQRLSTIAQFIAPEAIGAKALALTKLEYLREYDGYRFEQLPGRLQTRLEETEVVLHLIRESTPEKAKFNIFGRINTGGLPLSQQELRNALIPGRARQFLGELADTPSFRTATTNSVSPSRMADREMALRFLAFHCTDPQDYAATELDEFLRKTMHSLNVAEEAELRSLASAWDRTMSGAHQIFGENSFRKLAHDQKWRNPINKALFETTAVNLASRTPEQLNLLVHHREAVIDDAIELMGNTTFDRAISVGTGDRRKVHERFAMFDDMLRRHDGTP